MFQTTNQKSGAYVLIAYIDGIFKFGLWQLSNHENVGSCLPPGWSPRYPLLCYWYSHIPFNGHHGQSARYRMLPIVQIGFHPSCRLTYEKPHPLPSASAAVAYRFGDPWKNPPLPRFCGFKSGKSPVVWCLFWWCSHIAMWMLTRGNHH